MLALIEASNSFFFLHFQLLLLGKRGDVNQKNEIFQLYQEKHCAQGNGNMTNSKIQEKFVQKQLKIHQCGTNAPIDFDIHHCSQLKH